MAKAVVKEIVQETMTRAKTRLLARLRTCKKAQDVIRGVRNDKLKKEIEVGVMREIKLSKEANMWKQKYQKLEHETNTRTKALKPDMDELRHWRLLWGWIKAHGYPKSAQALKKLVLDGPPASRDGGRWLEG